MNYLFAAVLVMWIGILFYMFQLYLMQKKVNKQLNEMQK